MTSRSRVIKIQRTLFEFIITHYNSWRLIPGKLFCRRRLRLKIPLEKFWIECFDEDGNISSQDLLYLTKFREVAHSISLRWMKLWCKRSPKGIGGGGSDSDRSVVKKVPRESRIYRTDSEWLRVGMWSSVREVDKREMSDTSPHPILLLNLRSRVSLASRTPRRQNYSRFLMFSQFR